MKFFIQTRVNTDRFYKVEADNATQAKYLFENENVGDWVTVDSQRQVAALYSTEPSNIADVVFDQNWVECNVSPMLLLDANGREMDHEWGLRVCQHCGLVMSEGYLINGWATYCSDDCLIKGDNWVKSIEQFYEAYSDEDDDNYFTDWEGCDVPIEVCNRLVTEPYNWTISMINSLNLEEDYYEPEP